MKNFCFKCYNVFNVVLINCFIDLFVIVIFLIVFLVVFLLIFREIKVVNVLILFVLWFVKIFKELLNLIFVILFFRLIMICWVVFVLIFFMVCMVCMFLDCMVEVILFGESDDSMRIVVLGFILEIEIRRLNMFFFFSVVKLYRVCVFLWMICCVNSFSDFLELSNV